LRVLDIVELRYSESNPTPRYSAMFAIKLRFYLAPCAALMW
jgi:hypothetical protein